MVLNFIDDVERKDEQSKRLSFYKEYFNAPDWNMEYEKYIERLKFRQMRKLKELSHSPRFWELTTEKKVLSSNNFLANESNKRSIGVQYSEEVNEYGSSELEKGGKVIFENNSKLENVSEKKYHIEAPIHDNKGRSESKENRRPLKALQNEKHATKSSKDKASIAINVEDNQRNVKKEVPRPVKAISRPPFSLYGRGEPSNNHMTYNVLSPDHVYDSARRAKENREALKVKYSKGKTEKSSPRQLIAVQFARNNEENWMSEYQHCYSSRATTTRSSLD
ncbi:centriole, cilia and spindle-associated protein-like [Symsagittifera roscoffensis]|uniref:centriole, cilia and spindle-associated protein-like n=1 Tax=Symsagittifera roscoffensis TaxID=84072 RepID=UPI00307C97AE